MTGSQNKNKDIILAVYQDKRTVFRLKDIAMLTGDTNFDAINKKLNHLVQKAKLLNPRKGIYAKKDYNKEELACLLFTPAYISLEYVLQQAGMIFQYDSGISSVSYLSRTLIINDQVYTFRKIKHPILLTTKGIQRLDNHINIASPERAFLDVLYLHRDYHFDNLNPLNADIVNKLLPFYNSKALQNRVKKVFSNA